MIKKLFFIFIGLFWVSVGVILVVVLHDSNISNKGKDLLKNIKMRAQGSCAKGEGFEFEIKNESKFQLKGVTFRIKGTIDGRSSEYDVGPVPDYSSDIIIEAKDFQRECWTIERARWPQGEKLRLYAEVASAQFVIDKETIYAPYYGGYWNPWWGY